MRKLRTVANKRTKALGRTRRSYVRTTHQQQLLKRVGLKIRKVLSDQEQTTDWLAIRINLARSALCEIIAGRSDPHFLTLNDIAVGLGFRDVLEFLKSI